ncbi:Arginyl-tRNA synthetase [Linnemannia schmuckeri]|uniref:Arginyl-tRNA synthetase n=1 Tax=Linnemannia schmuckeri TaxID=64567 RepID=A0A9P5S144_9FUNG|nr:Arginyl-tRNA synthetase [Linnemannia schmuckeri]
MAESTLVSFRRTIATHLARIVGQPVESIFPLVQQNISHRKASHSVFSVVIKRLQQLQSRNGEKEGRAAAVLDEHVLEQCCTELSAETRRWIVGARMTKDMLLFDPQPLHLIQKAIGAIVERGLGGEGGEGGEREKKVVKDVLGKRARETLSFGEDNGRRGVVIVVDGVKTLQDENAFCSLRRTVLTGFVARFLSDESSDATVKVVADTDNGEFLRGLNVESLISSDSSNNISDDDEYLETMKRALQTKVGIKAQQSITEDGAWFVDLSAQKLGQVKVFSSCKTGETSTTENGDEQKEMGEPAAVVEVMVQMARRFARYGGNDAEVRYIWVVPDGRRLFAEQVLHLARIIFPEGGERRLQSQVDQVMVAGEGAGEGDEPERKKRARVAGSDVVADPVTPLIPKSWADSVEVVYYGPATGVDLPKDSSLLTATTGSGGSEMSGVVEYTNMKMRELVEQNRGNGGVGGYSGAYGDDGGYDDDEGDEDENKGLDETELSRMSKILSQSALVVSCCGGKRARKLNVSLSRILDGKGNSGVFLQYVLSRLYGIERKSKTRLNPIADLSQISSYTESFDLALLLAEYPEILSNIEVSLDPVEGKGNGGRGCGGEMVGVLGG